VPNPPAATTNAASAIGATTATLNAAVNPNGSPTQVHYEYGTTALYGSATSDVSAGSGTSAANVPSDLSGLLPGTTYHFRVVATNAGGTTNGSDQTFTTAPASTGTTPGTTPGTGDGTPPTGTTPTDTPSTSTGTQPTANAALTAALAAAKSQKGTRVKARLTVSEGASATVKLLDAKGRVVGKLVLRSLSAGTKSLTVKLTRAGLARLKKAKKLKLKLVVAVKPSDGGPGAATLKRSVTLRRSS
jgi:hypothetical protein